MYISVDRAGRVREAYPLNSDNPGLQDSARDQLLKWRVKPIVLNGRPIQAEAALSFHFETTLSAPPAQPAAGAGLTAVATASIPSPQIQVSPGVLQAFLLAHPEPVYPAAAKERKIQGKVVVALTVDRTGATKDIRVLSSPDQTLTDSAIAAVSQWRYTPYKLNGVTVDAQSTVEVNFKLP
jgi:protein TonB